MLKKFLVAALIMANAVFAQIHYGGRAAMNIGSAWGDYSDDANWGIGFNVGAIAKIGIDPIIEFIPGLEMDFRRFGIESCETEEYQGYDIKVTQKISLEMWYLDIPVVARANVVPRLHVDIGVLFSFEIAAYVHFDATVSALDQSETLSDNADYSKFITIFDPGLIAGFGVSIIPDLLDIDFRFVLGLASFGDEDAGVVFFRSQHMRMQLGATFWFL